MAGAPKIYGQLVQLLTPYTRVLKDTEATAGVSATVMPAPAVPDPTRAFVAAAAAPEETVKPPPVRIRKSAAPKTHGDGQ